MEIAVFGGTFDPPTKAHEAVIAACLARPELDEVWVMPSGTRSDKKSTLNDTDRLWMLNLMLEEVFANHPRLQVSSFELDYLPRPSQTAQTVEALRTFYPECRFRFVFGADSYLSMPQWRNGRELQRTLGMLVVPRNGLVIPVADNLELLTISMQKPVSSTEVRDRVRRGFSIDGLVCRGVRQYITDCRLYR